MAGPRTAEEAIAFLEGLAPSGVRLGLDRIDAALEALGNPERRFPVLHVAGTNGKGSTCAFATSCLTRQGYKVGLYTSPHLERVNERIRISGEEIPDALLGQRVLEVLERYPEALQTPAPLTYFEFGTLVALWHFAREQVDVAVLETGLGGRLDATAAAQPIATAIASISFDHMEYLGHTLGAIAREKAGILKPAVPVVVSRQHPEAMEALETAAREVGAPLWAEDRDFRLEPEGGGAYAYRGMRRSLSGLRLGLRGPHQAQNAALALACLELLEQRGLAVSDESARAGLGATRWPGRLEEFSGTPTVVLDGAHNPSGAQALRAALDSVYRDRKVHLVFGVLADKDHGPMLRTLFPRCASAHLTPVPTPRTLPPERYADEARALCGEVALYASPAAALAGARRRAAPEDVVLCAGSLFLVGTLRTLVAQVGAAQHGA